jgi:hypothetical protein
VTHISGGKFDCTSEEVRTRADHDLVDFTRVATTDNNEIGVFAFGEEAVFRISE